MLGSVTKNSKPDIQVLEARVTRIKSQLQQYEDLRLYNITKKRLSNVASELEDCISLIYSVIGDYSETSKEAVELKEPEQFVSPREDFEDDLSDVLSIDLESNARENASAIESYTPKQIVKTYSTRIHNCREIHTGILQVNQFCTLLDDWYQARFNPTIKNTKFHYKSQRIHEWIDLWILAAGDALHNKMFPSFKSDIDAWVRTLNTLEDQNWILPQQVMEYKNANYDQVTKEAVLIEKIVKSLLYDDEFYASELNSVEEIVIDSNKFSKADLEMPNLVNTCKGIVKTSAFDISKYVVGGQS